MAVLKRTAPVGPQDLVYPFSEESVRSLKLGARVRVCGRLFTGRDRLHRFLFDGGESPVDLHDGGIYHCGPVALQRDGGWQILAAGPTTSMREEPYMSSLLARHGIRVIIGKGGMGPATRRACRENGAVYLQAVGGAASVLAAAVRAVNGVHFAEEFGLAEAMWDIDVHGLFGVVTIDAQGRSLHERIARASRRELRRLLAG